LIDKEVLMSRTKQRTLQFDCLDSKVLLSAGLADTAVAVHRDVVKHFHLNGAFTGLPLGSAVQNGFRVSLFLVEGHAGSMHRVSGVLNLGDTMILSGKKPNLSNAALALANKEGSVVLLITKTTTRYYDFKVVAGTGVYTGAQGSGFLVVLTDGQSKALSYTIRLHTTSDTNSGGK
jgi:hypothetical protein